MTGVTSSCRFAAGALLFAASVLFGGAEEAIEKKEAIAFPFKIGDLDSSSRRTLCIDLGAYSTGGYAVFNVASFKGNPILRLSYANHPDGLGELGCFSRQTSARYLGPLVDIPVLPGNINRHEIYSICRTGRFVAPLIQGQARYVRLHLDTPASEVELLSFELENAQVFREGEFEGSFECSDKRLNELWKISAWTCQLASFPNHDAWKCAGGRLLPRKLEQASGEGWHGKAAPCDGVLRVEYEFDANTHFPVGRFEVLTGSRRTEVVQRSTNSFHVVEVVIKKGERFGLALKKESWPVIWRIAVLQGGRTVWESDFSSRKGLENWVFPRTRAFVADGAKRDRLIWSGDLWWAERNIFYSFNPGNDPYMSGSLELLAANQTPEGYVQACPYAERATPLKKGEYGPFPSDEFAAWFVPVLYDYHLYSGDVKMLRKLWPTTLRLMDYLQAHTAPNGLFVQRYETSKHAGSLDIGDTSQRSFMNILLWKCYEDAAAMAKLCNDATRHDSFKARAKALAATIREVYWNAESGWFAGRVGAEAFGFEANALALATRFATDSEARAIAPHLRRTDHGKFQALAARGLFEYGLVDDALRVIEAHNWFKLLSPQWAGALTVTECMSMITRGWGDESHPDTGIAGIFSSGILGIVPTRAGYAEFEFKPGLGESIRHASGRVPTPHGAIDVAWRERDGVLNAELSLPKGCSARLAFQKCARILVDGRQFNSQELLQAGRFTISVSGIKRERKADVASVVNEAVADKMRLSASSSHECGVWGLANLTAKEVASSAKGWSSKAHGSADAEEWILLEFGELRAVEKLLLWPRDDAASDGGKAGFPEALVVEGLDGRGVWRVLKKSERLKAPAKGAPFEIGFYTVIGHEKVKALRLRATKLGPSAADEKGVWRFQLKRIAVVNGE